MAAAGIGRSVGLTDRNELRQREPCVQRVWSYTARHTAATALDEQRHRAEGSGVSMDDSGRSFDEQDGTDVQELKRRFCERLSDWSEPGSAKIGTGSCWTRLS